MTGYAVNLITSRGNYALQHIRGDIMNSKRIAHKIYQVSFDDSLYEVDGQNHEGTSNEWELFQVNGYEREWCFTFDTKKEAISYLTTLKKHV